MVIIAQNSSVMVGHWQVTSATQLQLVPSESHRQLQIRQELKTSEKRRPFIRVQNDSDSVIIFQLQPYTVTLVHIIHKGLAIMIPSLSAFFRVGTWVPNIARLQLNIQQLQRMEHGLNLLTSRQPCLLQFGKALWPELLQVFRTGQSPPTCLVLPRSCFARARLSSTILPARPSAISCAASSFELVSELWAGDRSAAGPPTAQPIRWLRRLDTTTGFRRYSRTKLRWLLHHESRGMQVLTPPSLLLESLRRGVAQEAEAAERLLVQLLPSACEKACKLKVSAAQQIANMRCNRHMRVRTDCFGKIEAEPKIMRLIHVA